MQRTLVLLKPDTLQRGLVGRVITKLEDRGLKIVGAKMLRVDEILAHRHYEAHVDKPFFPGLIEFITRSPVIAMVIEGKDAVEVVRQTMGDTDPVKAAPGTIRGDFGLDIGRNIIHGSDSPSAADREIGLFFSEGYVSDYARDVDRWITES